MGGVASIPVDAAVKPKVICVGYQRTGTLSTAIALERLGYGPVAHGGSQLMGREDAYMRKLHHMFQIRQNREELVKAVAAVTAGFGAVADAPYNLFAEEMSILYPDARFILLTCEQGAWWKSFKPVAEAATTKRFRWYFWIAPGWRWWYYVGLGMIARHEELGLEVFTPRTKDLHRDYVIRTIPPERLLVMSVKDGWEPLCKFLREPVPNEPFPHGNETAAVAKLMPRAVLKVSIMWLTLGLVLATVLWIGRTWRR